MQRIELSAIWDDAKALGLSNRDLLSAIAGMFFLLPAVVVDQFTTPLPPVARDAASEIVFQRLVTFFELNWYILLANALVTAFGSLAMLTLILRAERPTVSESLKAALVLLPGYFIASLLQSFMVTVGLMLFILPGFYLIARLALIAPVAAAERQSNPMTILQRSAQLTLGNGWRIFALVAIIFVTAIIVTTVASTLLGMVATLLLPADLAELLTSVITGLLDAAIAVVFVLVSAALYRAATVPARSPGFSPW